MSRIAGIIKTSEPENDKLMIDRMLSFPLITKQWRKTFQQTPQFTFGYLGEGAPKLIEQDGVTVIMDGIIYNLYSNSEQFFTESQIIQLYCKFGFKETLRKLNGDFAIALFDSRTNTFWLGRDRFGVKPLYYAKIPSMFAFGSRLYSLLSLPQFPRILNRRYIAVYAASHYRYFDNEPDESPYENINQLPAAHFACFSNNNLTTHSYWSLSENNDFIEPENILAKRYRELLRDAVALRLKASTRPAFTLSGGMDSSAVLATAVDIAKHKQFVFSSVYSDKTYDETQEIQSMLGSHVEAWYPIKIDIPDVFSNIATMISLHDEPIATATWLSHFLLCSKVTQKGFHELFGGLGGDELNAGEYEHFLYFFADLKTSKLEYRFSQEVQMWIHHHNHPIFRKSFEMLEKELSRVIDFSNPGHCLPDHLRLRRYIKALNPGYFDLNTFNPLMEQPFRSYLKNRTYQDLTRETIPCCLRTEDRQTAAFGLNNFLPFLDHRLVEFMFCVPNTMKYNLGVTKHLLREAMKGLLPEETRTRIKKTGWNAPAHIWFSGKGYDIIYDMVNSQKFRQRGIYNIQEVLKILDEHNTIVTQKQNRDNHMMFLWQLVNLELWFQRCND